MKQARSNSTSAYGVLAVLALSCAAARTERVVALDVEPRHFIAESLVEKIEIREHTLSGGTKAMCYVIKTRSRPHEHAMGPWAPRTIEDEKDAGGIWFKDGELFDVDGAFVKNVATLYGDDEWKLYREDGSVRVTDTKAAFEAAARPDVAAEYNNYVVEGRAEWLADTITTYIIPIKPVFQEEPTLLGGGHAEPPAGSPLGSPPGGHSRPSRGPRGNRGGPPPGRGGSGGPAGPGGPPNDAHGRPGQGGVGLAFNGVNFDPPAPVAAILAAHTIAPFDDAGGHINPVEGYHYHAATGQTKEVPQLDGHAPMIGYALDGFGIYAHLDVNGQAASGLDECQGHSDDVRGYHYHVSTAAGNQILKGFRGETGSVTVEARD